MRGVVPDQRQRLLPSFSVTIAIRAPSGSSRARSRSSGSAGSDPRVRAWIAHLDRQRRAREARPDRRGGVRARGAVLQLQGLSVGECHRDRHLSASGYPPARRRACKAPARRLPGPSRTRNEDHALQTTVCGFCHDRAMDNSEQVSIAITLSPTQVDEVVRAASRSRAPSISTVIGGYLPSDLGRPAPVPVAAARTLAAHLLRPRRRRAGDRRALPRRRHEPLDRPPLRLHARRARPARARPQEPQVPAAGRLSSEPAPTAAPAQPRARRPARARASRAMRSHSAPIGHAT